MISDLNLRKMWNNILWVTRKKNSRSHNTWWVKKKYAHLSLFWWRGNHLGGSPGDSTHLRWSRLWRCDSCLGNCFTASCWGTHLFNDSSSHMAHGPRGLHRLYSSRGDGSRFGRMYSSRGMTHGPSFGRLYPSGHHSATNNRTIIGTAARRHDPSRRVSNPQLS